jgi:hypothetical protein
MNKPVALMGYRETLASMSGQSTDSVMQALGQNTGNLAFWHAVDSHIGNNKMYVKRDVDTSIINNECSILIIPAANFIGKHQDLSPYTNLLRNVEIPILILGLGLQYELGDNDCEMPETTNEFLSVVAAKNITIAARGHLTEKLLHEKGVRNVTVTGCPANYISTEIKFKYETISERVLLNFQIGKKYTPILPLVGNWVDGSNVRGFVWQGFEDPISYLANVKGCDADLLNAYCESLKPGMALDQFKKWIFLNSNYFLGIREWLDYCSRFTLSIGTRFHGNLLAIQAGVPSIFVVHDLRTQEMVELFDLPKIDFGDIQDCKTLERILSRVNVDMNPYLRKRQELGSKYFALLRDAGILVDPRFEYFQ